MVISAVYIKPIMRKLDVKFVSFTGFDYVLDVSEWRICIWEVEYAVFGLEPLTLQLLTYIINM